MSTEPDAPIAVDEFMEERHDEVCMRCGLEGGPGELIDFYCLDCNYEDGFDG